MATLYVIQTGQTTWEAQSRVESAAGAPLTEQGARTVEAAAEQLRGEQIGAIYASKGEAERQTAKLAAKILKLKVRTEQQLHEIDYGLWQGLTTEEIKRRQPKHYRQWTASPSSVCPPGGETLAAAQQRLRTAVRRILKRQKDASLLLVLRPVVAALLRCLLHGKEINSLWNHVDPNLKWERHEAKVDDLE